MAVVSAQEFKVAHKPGQLRKTSAMAPFTADLLELHKQGFTLGDLKVFLEKNGVTVSRAAIYAFLQRNKPVVTLQMAG